MSKRVPARINCPVCKAQFDVKLYRSLWVEYPSNRRLIADNELNLVTCPHCHESTRLEFSVLCTNVQRKIAIWYEPYPDPAVDNDMRQYAQHFGQNSFYAQAPRVRNWEDFKAKLTLMEALSHKDAHRSLPNPSEELDKTMGAFIKSLPQRRPLWLSHIRSPIFRFMYAALPMTGLVLFAALNHFDNFNRWLNDFGVEILFYYGLVTCLLFFLLTAISRLADNLQGTLTKDVRMYLFASICWVVMSSLVLWLFDPFDYGGFKYMYDREIAQMLFIVLGLPILIGFAYFSFKKYVK